MTLLVRLCAFLLDYLILACYGAAVFAVAVQLHMHEKDLSPGTAQLIGFLSLTLPVLLYFTLMENSTGQATIGKRVMHLKVTDQFRASAH